MPRQKKKSARQVTPQAVLDSEEEIVWVRTSAKSLPYVRERLEHFPRRKGFSAKLDGFPIVAFANLRDTAGSVAPGCFLRRVWHVDQWTVDSLPEDGVDPKSITAGRESMAPDPITTVRQAIRAGVEERKEARRKKHCFFVERIKAALAQAKDEPPLSIPGVILNRRMQTMAKVFRALCSNEPSELPTAALSEAMKLNLRSVEMYRRAIRKAGLIKLVSPPKFGHAAGFAWVDPNRAISPFTTTTELMHLSDNPGPSGAISPLAPKKAFWRPEPMKPEEEALLTAAFAMQAGVGARDSYCTHALSLTAAGSEDYSRSIVAALLASGGLSFQIREAMHLVMDPDGPAIAARLLANSGRVPGWGSLIEGEDPALAEAMTALRGFNPIISRKMDEITRAIHEGGEATFPNDCGVTAGVCLALRIPAGLAPWIVVAGRLHTWSQLAHQTIYSQPRG